MRKFGRVHVLALGYALLWLAATVQAQSPAPDYPSRPVKLIVAFTPGLVDTFARTVAQHLTERFGQPVVVDNRPCAVGNPMVMSVRTAG